MAASLSQSNSSEGGRREIKKEGPLSPKSSVRIYVSCLIKLDPQTEISTLQKETVIELESFRDDLRGRTAGDY